MQAFLIKAGGKGEGSRGGKIIGHTSSSKPIYEHHPAYNAARQKPAHSAAEGLTHFPKHTGKDHAESADAHITLANKHVSTNVKMANHHMAAAGVHHEADNALRRKALKKLSPAGALVKKSFTEKEDDMQAFLIKAGKGEGSRGGHIIGHTKNGGHPIYASTAATSRKYSDLGANDHVHARDMHKELAEHFAAKAKQSGISDEEKQHARASASNHRKQSQGHARKYAEMFGHYRNALTNGAMAAGASHKAPSNKAKEKAYLEGQDKVSAARAVYDGKPFKKSLDALYPSDGLHQMGAQYDQGNPIDWDAERASFAEQIAEKNKTKKSEGNDMQKFLSKAEGGEGSRGGHIIGHTASGAPIYASTHETYSKVKDKSGHTINDHLSGKSGKQGASAVMSLGRAVLGAHKGWLEDDHRDAAEAHGRGGPHSDYTHGDAHHTAANILSRRRALTDERTASNTYRKKQGISKSLDALHPSDGLHQMGAQFAQKHPDMSASDHMAASQKYAKAGQPHMAIGHMMASSYKSAVAKKSMAANVLRDYLSKAAKHYANTSSGAAIYSPMHSGYDAIDMHAHHAETYKGLKNEVAINKKHAPIVKKLYPSYTKQDHYDAYRHHEGNNNHAIAGAHFAASGFLKPKGVSKSLSKAGTDVLGKTSSGKSVFSADHHSYEGVHKISNHMRSASVAAKAVTTAYPSFNKQDHLDAARYHNGQAHEARSPKMAKLSQHASEAHLYAHGSMSKSLSKAASKGEGSRGGHIIGHTNTGKPVYASIGHAHTSENPDKSMVYFTDLSKAARNPMSTTLGHTTSGKPVRGDSGHHAPNLGFSKQDHGEAADFHMAAAQKISKKPFTQANQSTYNMHRIAHQMHMIHQKKMDKSLAGLHECESLSMFTLSKAGKTGEGSRGGKIIGHTKSGRPVYAADHADYAEPIRVRSINGGGQIPLTHHHLQGNVRAAHSLRGRRQDMTSQDHLDAAGIHASHAVKQQALHKKIFNSPKNLRQPGDDPHILAVSGPHSHLKESARNKAFAAIDSGRLSEAAAHLHMHAAKLAKRGEKANGGGVKKSFASHGFSKAEKGEGSRGGKIIGHTKSGKPIYGASHSDYHTAANKKGQSISESLVMPKGGFKGSAVKPIVDATLAMHRGWDSQDHHDAAQAHGKGHHALTVGDAHRFTAELLERREHNARINKRLKEKDGGQTIKSVAHGFNDMLKASGITMWAPKDEPAAPLALN